MNPGYSPHYPKNYFSNVKKFKINFLHVVQHISSQHKNWHGEKTFFATCAKKTNSDIPKSICTRPKFVFFVQVAKKVFSPCQFLC